MAKLDVTAIAGAIATAKRPTEVVFCVSIGTYVAFQDTVAAARAAAADAATVAKAVTAAVHLDRARDLDHDPAFGIAQRENIAWAATSSVKLNLKPTLLTVDRLRDILAHWAAAGDDVEVETSLIVYPDDVGPRPMEAVAAIALVASRPTPRSSAPSPTRSTACRRRRKRGSRT